MNEAWGIVVAGGRGRRYGAPKQFELLGGEPLWEWARRSLVEGGVPDVVVVGDIEGAVSPGERRRDSVAAGLAEVPPETRYVLVHDAARPLATPALVGRVLDRLKQGDVAGVVPGNPLRDATKRVEGERVIATVARESLVAVQTPQGFLASILRQAHDRFQGEAADDAEMVAQLKGAVVIVEGELTNLKVTVPEDLKLLAAIHAS